MGCSNDKSLNEKNKTIPQNEVKANINFNIKTEQIKEDKKVDKGNRFINPFNNNCFDINYIQSDKFDDDIEAYVNNVINNCNNSGNIKIINKNIVEYNNQTNNNAINNFKISENNIIVDNVNNRKNIVSNDKNKSMVGEEEEEEKIAYRKQDENILKNLDKEKLKKLVLNCPKRTSIELDDFVNYLVENTKSLKDIEKAYFLFYWMHENIVYDAENFLKGGGYDCTPKGAFRKGKTVCSGYSRLYKYLGVPIGLKVFCVNGYAKGYGYEPNMKIQGTNHEWNIIKIEDSFYQIDSTWGAGKLKDRKYIKKFDEFYFCPPSEHLIFSHLPVSDDHQLLEHPISKEEFSKRINIKSNFFKWFTHPDYLYQNETVKNRHTFRYFRKKEINEGFVFLPNFFHYEKNNYVKAEVPFLVKEEKDYIDFECIFNKKGKYKLSQFGKYNVKGSSDDFEHFFDVYVQCQKDSPKQYDEFPIEDIFLASLKKKIYFEESFYKYFKSCDTVYENTIVKDKYTIRLYKNKDNIELSLIFYYYSEKKKNMILLKA